MDSIKVEKRDEKAKAKQLRRNGIIPCNVYGGALEHAISIQMTEKAADQLCRTKRDGSRVQLELDGQIIPVQIKDKVVDQIDHTISHISFQALKADQMVNSVAHIFLTNAELVPGLLEQLLYEVPFTSLPKDMIDTVTLDLEGVQAGTTIMVRDIPEFQNEKIKLRIEDDAVVLQIKEKKSAAEEPEETEEE